jgi:hypothetical protein
MPGSAKRSIIISMVTSDAHTSRWMDGAIISLPTPLPAWRLEDSEIRFSLYFPEATQYGASGTHSSAWAR